MGRASTLANLHSRSLHVKGLVRRSSLFAPTDALVAIGAGASASESMVPAAQLLVTIYTAISTALHKQGSVCMPLRDLTAGGLVWDVVLYIAKRLERDFPIQCHSSSDKQLASSCVRLVVLSRDVPSALSLHSVFGEWLNSNRLERARCGQDVMDFRQHTDSGRLLFLDSLADVESATNCNDSLVIICDQTGNLRGATIERIVCRWATDCANTFIFTDTNESSKYLAQAPYTADAIQDRMNEILTTNSSAGQTHKKKKLDDCGREQVSDACATVSVLPLDVRLSTSTLSRLAERLQTETIVTDVPFDSSKRVLHMTLSEDACIELCPTFVPARCTTRLSDSVRAYSVPTDPRANQAAIVQALVAGHSDTRVIAVAPFSGVMRQNPSHIILDIDEKVDTHQGIIYFG